MPPNLDIAPIASHISIVAFSFTDTRFFLIVSIEFFALSVNTTIGLLKRDKHSKPNAPDPAKTSQTDIGFVVSIIPFNILNNAPRAIFCVGRASGGKDSFLPRYFPEIICKFDFMV